MATVFRNWSYMARILVGNLSYETSSGERMPYETSCVGASAIWDQLRRGRARGMPYETSCAGCGVNGVAKGDAGPGGQGQSLSSQMTAPVLTVAPTSATREVTVPALWALRGFSIFMASSTTITSPSATD